MLARTCLHLSLPWLGAPLLLAWFTCAPAAVQAGCGDYLRPLTTEMPNHANSSPADHHLPHAPCSGPNCSGSKQPVPATPLVPVSVDRENAVVLASILPPGGGGQRQGFSLHAVRPIHGPTLIYHPPRISGAVVSA